MQTGTKSLKTFLSPPKTIIYLLLVVIGFILKFSGMTGNTLILIGCGLFYGHLCSQSIRYPKNLLLRILVLSVTTAFICGILLKFHTFAAIILVSISILASIAIEWISK